MRAKVGASTALASISSRLTSRSGPTTQVCLVSHHGQPTAQPCRRTNTDGVPACRASPWMDWNTSLTAKVSGTKGRAALAGFIDLNTDEADPRAGQQVWSDAHREMGGDILGRRIERHSYNTGIESSQSRKDGVLLPDQHAVIPVVLQPLTQERLDHAEIDHATEVGKLSSFARQREDVSMSVQVAALTSMT